MYYTRFDTSLCEIILAGSEEGLGFLHLNTGEGRRKFVISEDWVRNDEFFSDTRKQLDEYLEGERKVFDVKLNPEGTDFQKRVWKALCDIPYGETRSYRDIAEAAGSMRACRAAGSANGKNPIPVIIPCHRVVGSDGKLSGFAYGLAMKERLLSLERGNVEN